MNRLILLGNGFDLAHGLKTSYNDFITWYLKRCFIESSVKGIYEDILVKIYRNEAFDWWRLVYPSDVAEYVQQCYENGFGSLFESTIGMRGISFSGEKPFIVEFQSKLLDVLLQNCSYTQWVDIEREFYRQLQEILNDQNDSVTAKETNLKQVNDSLKFIINKLQEYLTSLPKPTYNDDYISILMSKVKHRKTPGVPPIMAAVPNRTLILNFNYTNTVSYYVEWFKDHPENPMPTVNFIHGQLNNINNPLVFGFGDELDKSYLRMEEEEAKGYFDYIKSFWYFRTINYDNLSDFINEGPYQICILGHSCGLSDRTMLNMVFEHTNCNSIKIYYHGSKEENNYTSITHEIARHFKNKVEMRNKIVSLPLCSPMPQVQII